MLRAATEPNKRRDFRRVSADGFELYISLGLQRHEPETLDVELRRFPRRHLTAFWNGCPWVGGR